MSPLTDTPLERTGTYSDSMSLRSWETIVRYLTADLPGIHPVAHPSGGYRVYQYEKPICRFIRHSPSLSIDYVTVEADGDSPLWLYVALLRAVVEAQSHMRER